MPQASGSGSPTTRAPSFDGAGWNVELRHAGHSMKSEGYYNYPPEFDAFRNAVDQLISDSRHKPPYPQK